MTSHYIVGILDTLALSGSNDGRTPILTTLQLKIEQFYHLTDRIFSICQTEDTLMV